MSKNKPPTAREYTDAIIELIRRINPHDSAEGRIGYVYASGFLASYMASLAKEDPYIYKRFERHCEHVIDRKNKSS